MEDHLGGRGGQAPLPSTERDGSTRALKAGLLRGGEKQKRDGRLCHFCVPGRGHLPGAQGRAGERGPESGGQGEGGRAKDEETQECGVGSGAAEEAGVNQLSAHPRPRQAQKNHTPRKIRRK